MRKDELIQILNSIQNLDENSNPGQIDLENKDWTDFLELFAKIKLVRIIYMRLTNTSLDWVALNSTWIFHHLQVLDSDQDIAGLGEIFNDLLIEPRWFSWNPNPDTSISLSDDVAVVLSQEDGQFESFQKRLANEITADDLDDVAEMVVLFLDNQLSDLNCECSEYEVRIRKLPWIHTALQSHVDPAIQKILKEGVTGKYCYQGKDSVYCLEAVVDSETYDHYPKLFAPFKTTVLEMLAKEACEQERRKHATTADTLKIE